MGNYSSCCFISHQLSQRSTTAKLVDSQGKLRRVQVPIKAGELMIEEPGHVISPANDLRRTGRIVALRADDELLTGKVYLLVPSSRVHDKVTEADMAAVESASVKQGSKKKRRCARVLPAVPVELKEEKDYVVKVFEENKTGLTGCQFRKYRPWNPVLESIPEAL